jgi:hypothetical protein
MPGIHVLFPCTLQDLVVGRIDREYVVLLVGEAVAGDQHAGGVVVDLAVEDEAAVRHRPVP